MAAAATLSLDFIFFKLEQIYLTGDLSQEQANCTAIEMASF